MKKSNKCYLFFFSLVFLMIPGISKATLVDPSVTSYVDSHDGITVNSQTYLDTQNGYRIFDILVTNASGDTLYDISTTGEDFDFGFGLNLPWDTDIVDSPILNEDSIRFYNNSIDDGTSEDFIIGSNLLETWGTRQMIIKGLSGQVYDFTVLSPEIAIPEPATLTLLILGSSVFLRGRS